MFIKITVQIFSI